MLALDAQPNASHGKLAALEADGICHAIINRDPTPSDAQADLVLHANIAETLDL